MFKSTPAFTSFAVSDLDKARQFFGQTLGVRVGETPEGLTLHLAGGHEVQIHLRQHHVPGTFTVLNFRVDNVDKAVDELTRRGVRFEMYDQPGLRTDGRGIMRNGGPPIAWFRDPSGNLLSVVEEPAGPN